MIDPHHQFSAYEDTDLVYQALLEREIAQLLVDVLDLQIEPEAISPTGPLYRDGLGLDEIDLLDLALEVSGRYGLHLRSDSGKDPETFASVRSLAAHVAKHRTR